MVIFVFDVEEIIAEKKKMLVIPAISYFSKMFSKAVPLRIIWTLDF